MQGWRKRSPCSRLCRRPCFPRRVSILVAAWNEEAIIDAHLASIESLTYPNLEYILCAGGKDRTLEIAMRHAAPAIQVFEQNAGEGKQKALQRCLERASGELIFLTDADCILDDAVVTNLIYPIVNEEESVASGNCAPLTEQTQNSLVLQQWFAEVYVKALRGLYIAGIQGANAALKRETLNEIGNFEAPV